MNWIIAAVLAFTTHANANTKSELALNWKPEPEFGGFYEAALNQLYEKAGLDLTLLPGGAGQPVAQMIAAKKVKYGIVAADELILARAKGAKIVALFAVYQDSPMAFMVRRERNIKSLKELFQSEGTIALQKGLPYTLWLEKMYGPYKAKIVPYTGGVTQFVSQSGPNKDFSQQCFVFSEPVAARREKIEPKTFLTSDSGFNPYLAVVAAHEDTVSGELSEVRAMIRATKQGWEQYLKDAKKTNIEMQKLNPSLDLGTFDEASKLQKPLIETKYTQQNGLGVMSVVRWKTLYDQLVELKLVKAGMDPASFYLK